MKYFKISAEDIDIEAEKRAVEHVSAGAFLSFEGWVRDHNGGRRVERLDYEAYVELAETEGAAIMDVALARDGVRAASAVHRVGALKPGDLAVWVGVSSDHRDAAFTTCRWLIDEIKRRVPIWKNEYYADGESGWIHPEDV